jgi:hypothetical protein
MPGNSRSTSSPMTSDVEALDALKVLHSKDCLAQGAHSRVHQRLPRRAAQRLVEGRATPGVDDATVLAAPPLQLKSGFTQATYA